MRTTGGHRGLPPGRRVNDRRTMRVQPLICAYSPLRGNRRLSQLVEQRLGLFEIGGIEAFGKPAEDRGEQCYRLLLPALLSAQAG